MANEKMEKPDFSKIWGENGNVTYKFSDDNYLKGWGFVGNIPPARGMFDAYFQGTDKKLKWLDNALGDYVNRDYTIDDTKNPTDNKDTLPNLLSGMANMIKTTNGTDDWKKPSATSLKDLSDQIASNNLYHAESTGYGIVSGCEPSISGLTVTVGAGVVHLADGTRKEIVQTNITLDNADPTNPRVDLVYIDSTGTVAKITGTAASPSAPTLPSGGISVAQVNVSAGATTGTINYKAHVLPVMLESTIGSDKNIYAFKYIANDDTNWAGYTAQGADYNAQDGILYVAGIKNGGQRIFRYRVVETQDRITDVTLIDYFDYTTLGHCNSVAYCIANNKIYVTKELEDKSFTIITAATMAIESTRTLSEVCYNMTYDSVKDVFVVLNHSDGNGMWRFIFYDKSFNELNRFSVYSGYATSIGNINCLSSYNGRIINVNSFSITEIDFFGNIIKQIPLYNAVEFEAITRFKNKYIMTAIFANNALVVYEFDKSREFIYSFANKNQQTLYKGQINLNTVTSNGNYYITGGSNLPTGVTNGVLQVTLVKQNEYWDVSKISNIAVVQKFICTDDTTNKIYQREWLNNAWGSWKRVDAKGALPIATPIEITPSGTIGEYTVTQDGWLTMFGGEGGITGVQMFPTYTNTGASDISNDDIPGKNRYASILVRNGQTIKYNFISASASTLMRLRFIPLES